LGFWPLWLLMAGAAPPRRGTDVVGGVRFTLVGMSRFERRRSTTLGLGARPVSIPDDVDDVGAFKERGVVELPLRVRWSGPERRYDLRDRRQRALVYEQVLAEGTDEEVRRFIDVNELVDLWPDLVLPRHVRAAWAGGLRERRSIVVAC
jgi:hypothetical protein